MQSSALALVAGAELFLGRHTPGMPRVPCTCRSGTRGTHAHHGTGSDGVAVPEPAGIGCDVCKDTGLAEPGRLRLASVRRIAAPLAVGILSLGAGLALVSAFTALPWWPALACGASGLAAGACALGTEVYLARSSPR